MNPDKWQELRETVAAMRSEPTGHSFMHDVSALLSAHDALREALRKEKVYSFWSQPSGEHRIACLQCGSVTEARAEPERHKEDCLCAFPLNL